MLILGDALIELKKLKSNSVDMVLTDPPFFISREVTIHRSMNPKKYKYVGKDIELDFGEWDHFDNEKDYWDFTKGWFGQCARILKPMGHLVTFFDQDRVSHLIDYSGIHAMQRRQHLYWLKNNPVPRARKVDFMIALEAAIWFTESTRSGATFNYRLGQQVNYIKAPIVPKYSRSDGKRVHPTQKPLKVAKTWIRYLSNRGDTILDPFFGSGWACIAAKRLGRKYIGIEKDKKYFLHAEKILENIPDIPLEDYGVMKYDKQ